MAPEDGMMLDIMRDRLLRESPEVIRWWTESQAESILDVLEARFGLVPTDVVKALATVAGVSRLRRLNRVAATCPDFAAVVAALPADAP